MPSYVRSLWSAAAQTTPRANARRDNRDASEERFAGPPWEDPEQRKCTGGNPANGERQEIEEPSAVTGPAASREMRPQFNSSRRLGPVDETAVSRRGKRLGGGLASRSAQRELADMLSTGRLRRRFGTGWQNVRAKRVTPVSGSDFCTSDFSQAGQKSVVVDLSRGTTRLGFALTGTCFRANDSRPSPG